MTDARTAVARKLHPAQVSVSPKFQALLSYLLDEAWTTPRILELAVTTDGLLNVWTDDGNNALVGDVSSLMRNIHGVAAVAELDAEETTWLLAQVPARGTSGPVRGTFARKA